MYNSFYLILGRLTSCGGLRRVFFDVLWFFMLKLQFARCRFQFRHGDTYRTRGQCSKPTRQNLPTFCTGRRPRRARLDENRAIVRYLFQGIVGCQFINGIRVVGGRGQLIGGCGQDRGFPQGIPQRIQIAPQS